jgi:glycosyltransferase involved in cell wall biosynthesis
LLFASSTPLTAGIPGIFASLLRRKPFVFEVRDLWPELPREMGVITNPVILWAMSVLEWLSYHTAKGCVGLSPGIVRGIVRRGISESKVAMVPNGCDLELFNPAREESLRPEGARPEDFLAVFTGAHGMANGLDAVLDAAVELKKKGRFDIKLVFIGDGKLKPALMKRAKDDGLDNCLFMDPVPKLKLTAYLRGADAGLMILANVPAFYYGTSPNKFFDYIAIGLPVLNNYPGWLAGMIEAHKCGIAVAPENPVAFAEALMAMANDRELTRQMGRNGRNLAEKDFNRVDLGNRLVNYLEKVCRQ